ncbi:V-type ATP synthase subunit E [Methanogenium cariaci]|uniref:V-type ATP synthase subunit E n=1 Tax=Methanogenium cariaci TaxID=2197 RepID=UPI00155DAF33|nr:V-type ATP synthase subunit E family protein [Methanogenium cariaci]
MEEIIARINADADAEAARIRQVAADEAARIQREGETAAEAAYTTITADGRREAAARQRRIIARAQLAARGGNVRKTREEGITRCFAGAKEHLSLLPPHLPIYPDVLRHLITEGQEVIGPGTHEVLFREEDQDAAETALAAFPDVTAALLRETTTDRSGGRHCHHLPDAPVRPADLRQMRANAGAFDPGNSANTLWRP